jgi:hypothetical protein
VNSTSLIGHGGLLPGPPASGHLTQLVWHSGVRSCNSNNIYVLYIDKIRTDRPFPIWNETRPYPKISIVHEYLVLKIKSFFNYKSECFQGINTCINSLYILTSVVL